MISYIEIINVIEEFASNHLQIRRFGADYIDQVTNFAGEDDSYPILYVAPDSTNPKRNSKSITFNVYCYDLLLEDRSNAMTIYSDCELIISDLTTYLRDSDYNIQLLSDPTTQSINNDLLDSAVGVFATFNIDVDSISLCEIPFNDNFTPGIPFDIQYRKTYLTCDTLEDCPVIQTIQDDITNLENVVYRTNSLLSGGAIFLSGLTYDVTPLEYIINGQFYTTTSVTQVTTNIGDPTYDRIDLIVVDINGVVSILEGDPSENPVQPDVDETTQVIVALITVPAGATSIPSSETVIYYDNLGTPTEWTASLVSDGGAIDLGYTTITYGGSTASIKYTNAQNLASTVFTAPAPFDTITQNTLQFAIYNTQAWTSNVRITLRLQNIIGNQLGSLVQVYGNKYGFSSGAGSVGTWQIIQVPIADFLLPTNIIGKVKFETFKNAGTGLYFILDNVKLVAGPTVPSDTRDWFKIQGDTSSFSYPTVANATLRLQGGSNINTVTTTSNATINLNSTISVTGSVTANTYYGDGSNLTGIISGGETLENTLALGNESGIYSIIMGTGTSIKSGNSGGQIDLDAFGTPGEVMISTDNGGYSKGILYLSDSYVELSNYDSNGGVGVFGNNLILNSNNSTKINGSRVTLRGDGGAIDIATATQSIGNVLLLNNKTVDVEALNLFFGDRYNPVFINSKNSIVKAGVNSTVLIGCDGITATTTGVYVSDLIVESGKGIRSYNTGGRIDLDYAGGQNILISTDDGGFVNPYVYMNSGSISISSPGVDGSEVKVGKGVRILGGNGIYGIGIGTKSVGMYYQSTISIEDSSSQTTTHNTATTVHTFINSTNSTLDAGVNNSVVIGGSGLTGSVSNTVYVSKLNIKTPETTIPTKQIALDVNGFITEDKLFYIGVNFETIGVTWSYVAPEAFKVNTIDNPSGYTYSITNNGSPYTLGSSISLYDTLQIGGVTGSCFLKLNSEIV